MVNNIKYRLTNWVDGMKIHKQHFIDSENALLDAIRDTNAALLTNFNFGLLPPVPGEKKSLEISILKPQSDNFILSLSLCRAITAGGSRIEIMPQFGQEIICEEKPGTTVSNTGRNSKQVNSFYAVVTADVFNRQPSGEPSPDEAPPRHPFANPRYELHIVPEENVSAIDFGSHHFPVARFKTKGAELMQDDTYIPPCTAIQSHPAMIKLYNNIGNNLNRVQEFSTIIVQKVIGKSQNTPLAQNIKAICEKNVYYVSSIFFAFRMVLPYTSPVFIAETVAQLASVLKVVLDFMPEKEKEEMLQYFKEWNETSPSAFQAMVAAAIEMEYDHYAIYESFLPAVNFLTRYAELLEKLSELELIGKRKEKDIFVRELSVPDGGKPGKKKGFSLLD